MIPDLNGLVAILGGISGIVVIAYAVLMVHYTRKRSADTAEMLRRVRALEVQGARVEGLLIGVLRGGRK